MQKYAKNLKADIVFITENTIYGTDSSFSYLKTLSFINDINLNIIYIQKDMNNFIKESTNTILYSNNMIQSGTQNMIVNIPTYVMNFTELVDRVNHLLNFKHNLILDDIRGQEEFENLINLKSSQGMGLFRINGYILTLFKNLLPVNKKDKVALSIRDIAEDRFLATFTVMKPKNVNISIFIMYLKIK